MRNLPKSELTTRNTAMYPDCGLGGSDGPFGDLLAPVFNKTRRRHDVTVVPVNTVGRREI